MYQIVHELISFVEWYKICRIVFTDVTSILQFGLDSYSLVLLGVSHVDCSHLPMWLSEGRMAQGGGHNTSGDGVGYLGSPGGLPNKVP